MTSKDVKPWASLSWPNRITIGRLVLVAPFVWLLINQQKMEAARYVALAIFVVMAISDMLDGLLARRLNAKTRLGAILDPMADKALVICAVVLLSMKSIAAADAFVLPNFVVVFVVGKDIWVIAGFLVLYMVTDSFRVEPTRSGKLCTFGQLCMVGFTLIAPDLDRLGWEAGSRTAFAFSFIVAGLSVASVVSYTRLGLRIIATEQKPLDAPVEKLKKSKETYESHE